MTLDQLQELARQTEIKMRQMESLISILEAVPEDADCRQMIRALLDVQIETIKVSRDELKARLDSIRPALANIIIASPVSGPKQ